MRPRLTRYWLAAALTLAQLAVIPALSGGLVLCVGSDGHRAVEFAALGLCCSNQSRELPADSPRQTLPAPVLDTGASTVSCGPCADFLPLEAGWCSSTRKTGVDAYPAGLFSGPAPLATPRPLRTLDTPMAEASSSLALVELRTVVIRA